MFTGIISHITQIQRVERNANAMRVVIHTPKRWKLAVGESIACNGICSTVATTTSSTFTVEYTPETLQRTTARHIQKNDYINLERSATPNQRLSGHFVYGHIDDTGTVSNVRKNGNAYIFTIQYNPRYRKYLAPKGSVTVNGISLTVNSTTAGTFNIVIIPYTWHHTNMHHIHTKDKVNIEYDQIAKYIESILHYGQQS